MKCSALIIGELKLKLIFMSEEVEKINLCRLKMDETFNSRGRNACMILARSSNIDEIVGTCECQVISLSAVCVFPSASLSQCVGT